MALALKIVGKTKDGWDVVAGVFPYVDQEGIPLDLVRETLKEKHQVVALDDFVTAALVHGWKHKTILRTLRDAGYPEDLAAFVEWCDCKRL